MNDFSPPKNTLNENIIFISEQKDLDKYKNSLIVVVSSEIPDEYAHLQDIMNQIGFPEAVINWNAFYDDICDLYWLPTDKKIIFWHDKPLIINEKSFNIYLDIMLSAVYQNRFGSGGKRAELILAFKNNTFWIEKLKYICHNAPLNKDTAQLVLNAIKNFENQ